MFLQIDLIGGEINETPCHHLQCFAGCGSLLCNSKSVMGGDLSRNGTQWYLLKSWICLCVFGMLFGVLSCVAMHFDGNVTFNV